uniref:CGL160/ATPI domain-containing protein n=1 Tax=Davidia involucrata TaxID=16924 RepID=A0A5B7BB07_DAVIN
MDCVSGVGWCSTSTCTIFALSSNQSLLFPRNKISPTRHRAQSIPTVVSVLRSPRPVSELAEDDVLQTFFKERELNGDLISRVSDILWLREVIKFVDAEAGTLTDTTQLSEEALGNEDQGGFLKLTRTQEWVFGDNTAPVNKKMIAKELQNDSERRKRLNLLRYEALKREMLLLTVGIGTVCSGYCLAALSFQAAVSYAAGVLFSCLYLQLLCQHADNLSKEMVPQIFTQKKSKKIGIRSQDLEDLFERLVKGSGIALSSPRLVIPAAIYGIWGLSQHFAGDLFDFQLVPAMVGMFAYKAAALVQVYRDNEDLQLVFPENEVSDD